MAIHDDGTMDVNIDGKIERRKYVVTPSGPWPLPHRERCEPELNDGEHLWHIAGEDVPQIVKANYPELLKGRAPREFRELFLQDSNVGFVEVP